MSNPQETLTIGQERDLYLRLLALGKCQNLKPLLTEALTLILEITSAKKGYLAIYGAEREEHTPRFFIERGCSEEDLTQIREAISFGIIAEALATGQTICIGSALEDRRFQRNESVQANQIHEVLCAPIVGDVPLGVLYLQDRAQEGPFSDEDKRHAELFSEHLAPFVDRLLTRETMRAAEDFTSPFRARLKIDGLIGKSAALAWTQHITEFLVLYFGWAHLLESL